MTLLLASEQIKTVLKDFYQVTNLRIAVYDLNFQEIIGYPKGSCLFCSLIKASEAGKNLCIRCDANAKNHVAAHKKTYIYQCHAGLSEAIAPIWGYQEIIGYIMMGQVRKEHISEVPASTISRISMQLDLNPELLTDAWLECTKLSHSKLLASSRLMQMYASYIWRENMVKKNQKTVASRVIQYIDEHYTEEITLEILCNELQIGKTRLCSEVRHSLDTSVSSLIRAKRIEAAKSYLLSTSCPIHEIAVLSGISDYNYFIKVFKKETGMTPTEFRSANPIHEI